MKKITRGISKEFAEAFKKSELYKLYEGNKEDLIIGVRNNYLNIYYNCDSIAKVKYNSRKEKITCEINTYYIDGQSRTFKDKDHLSILTPKEIKSKYCDIKKNSDKKAQKKSKNEKIAQSQLYINNNSNKDSNWFCIDIEYVKAFKNQAEKQESKLSARFDIIAISKPKNNKYRVVLIELKYGSGSMGGKSGIYKHVRDFSEFTKQDFFESQLKGEIIHIIESQINLGIQVPFNLPLKNVLLDPEFFFITLDNNKKSDKGSTPKQTMAGYLFKDSRWGCKKLSTKYCVEEDFGDVTKKSKNFNATFLFSKEKFDNDNKINISDIIDGSQYERVEPN